MIIAYWSSKVQVMLDHINKCQHKEKIRVHRVLHKSKHQQYHQQTIQLQKHQKEELKDTRTEKKHYVVYSNFKVN